jgi:hypothetical protein
MPRVSAKSENETVEIKTPRKRAAPKKPTTKKVAATKAVRKAPVKRKTATKKGSVDPIDSESELNEQETIVVPATPKTRKAPTAFASQVAKKKTTQTQVAIIVALLVVGVGASAAVGFTDSTAGQIDVAQTIQERNERMSNMVDVDGPTIIAPRQNANNVPDGGFLGVRMTDPSATKPPAESTGTSTATSSASTTTDGVEGEPDEKPVISQDSSIGTATTTVTAVSESNDEMTE